MEFDFGNIDTGRLLTIAGVIVTAIGSFITSEQQKQQNKEIAREVANILRDEIRKEF